MAAIVAVGLALPVELTLGEGALDRAIAIEQASRAHESGPELFSRAEQRGGLVVGQLVLGAGLAFVLAGAATLLSQRWGSSRSSVTWLWLVGAAAWSITLVPGAVFPPLMPGMASDLSIGVRQLLYVAVILCGAIGFVAASALVYRLEGQPARRRIVAACGTLVAGLAVTLLAFPRQSVVSEVPNDALVEFRVASLLGQSLFWIGMAAVGFALLRRLEAPATGSRPWSHAR